MKKRIMAVVVTAAMVMGALAGCGSSSAKETQAPASTEAASETAAASETTGETEASDAASGDLTHVNVAYMANYASLWQVATAINKGYFKDEGLDVQLYMFQDGPTEIASMESGSIDVAYIGPGAHKLCNSVGLTMDDIEAYDMEVSNMVSAIVSGSIDACAPWSPSSTTIANELGDDVQTFCTNTTFSDIAADCASWICMPSYAETNKDVLVKFTKALYKAMDFASNPDNYDEVAGYVAQECGTDKESALAQTGDGAWLDSATLLKYVGDGTIKGYYEVQQKNFIDNGDVESEVPVDDYVLFDVMEEAGK